MTFVAQLGIFFLLTIGNIEILLEWIPSLFHILKNLVNVMSQCQTNTYMYFKVNNSY